MNHEEKPYFIPETGGSDNFMNLRPREQLLIHCGKKRFDALADKAHREAAANRSEVKAQA